jgi:hypothetical protein
VGTIKKREAASMTHEERCRLLCALVDADDHNDALALARLGWILFDLLCRAQQARSEAVDMLDELRVAARAMVSGDSGQASADQVRDVLARHGWLHEPAQVPARVLAGSG